MKIEEIRQRNDDELETLAAQLQEDLYGLRVQRATNQLENTSALRVQRRDLARVETIRRARRLGLEQAGDAK